MKNLAEEVIKAVQEFWRVLPKGRASRASGRRGKHLQGFTKLCRRILIDAGLTETELFWTGDTELPGFYRAERSWSLVAVADEELVVAIEVQALIGRDVSSHFNGRVEEVVGSATDLWAAYEANVFPQSQRPWLGYLLLLEDCSESTDRVKVRKPHFPVLPEFKRASYAKRSEQLLLRLVQGGLYNAASLIFAHQSNASIGLHTSPRPELEFEHFVSSLTAHVREFVQRRAERAPNTSRKSRKKRP